MSETSLMPPIKAQFFDSNGNPAAGGSVYTWQAGTVNTAKATYTNSTGLVENSNPVTLDSNGMANIWLSGYYHIQVYDALGNVIADVDNVSSMPNTNATQSEWVSQNIVLTYSDANNFTTPGTLTSTFPVGQRVKATVSAGTIYGTVSNSTAGGSPVVTTVTVTWDSGSLDSGLSAVWTGIINVNNTSFPTKTLVGTVIPGYVSRSKITYKDTDEIYLDPAVYHHQGTSEQIVYWDSQLTFQFGSGGTNEDSSDLAVSDWYYVYLDDSAIVTAGTNVITASEIVAVTTEPSWSAAKHGWYNGNDRCIFAVKTNGSSQVEQFYHDGDLVLYDTHYATVADELGTTWTDIVLNAPSFATRMPVRFYAGYVSAATYVDGYWRTNGQSGTYGHTVYQISADTQLANNTLVVISDSSQTIEVKHSTAEANDMVCYAEGYYLPTGM